MSRPIPTWPRGPRRRRPARPAADAVLLGCPRLSPEWELATVAALMKPKPATRGVVEHRDGLQPWPADNRLANLFATAAARLGVDLTLHASPGGEYHAVASVPSEYEPHARALAAVLSRALPDAWFVVGRLFVRGGRFYRRRRGYQLELTPAADVHVPRDVRAKLRGLV